MTPIRTVLSSLLLAGAFAGAARADESPLLVVIEGFNSCGENPPAQPLGGPMTGNLNALQQKFSEQRGEPLRLVYACHGLVDGGPLAMLGPIDLRYTTSAHPEQVSRQTFPEPFADRIAAAVREGRLPEPLAALADVVRQEIDAHPGAPVYVVGHSFGGWASMRFVKALQRPVHALVTLDPLSPLGCNPRDVFGQIIFGTPQACKEAPADIGGEERAALAEATDVWVHDFQTQFTWLHSSPIGEADQSNLLTIGGTSGFSRSAHNVMAYDPQVWAQIEALLLN